MQLSKMSFDTLCNQQDIEPSFHSFKKRRLQHSIQELEAAAQLTIFNFYVEGSPCSSTTSSQCEKIPPSPQTIEESEETKSYEELSESKELKCNDPSQMKRKRPCVLTDITHLLTLPQKEAARILGISESMLCKRFKEQTQRKWPYRYLRKVERQIMLKKKSKKLTVEDHKKLELLNQERDKCLASVQIRLRPTNDSKFLSLDQIASESFDSESDDN